MNPCRNSRWSRTTRPATLILSLFSFLLPIPSALATQESTVGDGAVVEELRTTQRNLPTATALLERMSQAVKTQNYQVSFVQSRAGSETVPFLWRHGVMPDGSHMEQLNLQNGPGRELIRVGDVVSVFEPDVPPYSIQSSYINGPIPNELLYNPLVLKASYDFVVVGRARVSGRPAQQLRIVSRDNSRFNYHVWLDEETGMLLKLNMFDLKGVLLEQIQVTHLTMLEQPHEYFSRVNQALLPQPMIVTPNQPKRHNWYFSQLPAGMEETRREVRRLAVTGQVVEYLMLSDGLVDVSVYIQAAKDAIGSDVVLRHDLNTFLTLTDGNYQVTIVGEIPLKTANILASSLTRVAQQP